MNIDVGSTFNLKDGRILKVVRIRFEFSKVDNEWQPVITYCFRRLNQTNDVSLSKFLEILGT